MCIRDSLKALCGLLRDEDRLSERNEFLTNVFRGATIDEKSKLYNIGRYKWDKIFTLNIDCLLEYIFEQTGVPYKVWNRDKDDRRNNNSSTLIIKLHGCVKNEKAGYIFDEYEYIDFLNDDDCFSRDFGDAYSKGDVVFIGTEFQESDLKTIINKYNSAGYDVSGNNYFFITPEINNVSLRRQMCIRDRNMTAEQLRENVMEYVSRLEQKEISEDEKSLEEFLEDRGAAITVLYASDGVGENYPIHFFDAAYDADTGSAYFSELTPKEQADMLVEKAEFPRTIFTEEEKAFVTEYAETFPGQVERLNDLVWDMRESYEEAGTNFCLLYTSRCV